MLTVWLGRRTSDTQAPRLEVLGWALLGMIVDVPPLIVSFAIGGPVGRLRGGIGLASVEASAVGDGAPIAQVTTTTTAARPALVPSTDEG